MQFTEMNKQKQCFLRFLYFQLFEVYQRERKLRRNTEFPNDNECIRNDQSIAEVRMTGQMLDKIIAKYLEF